MPSLPDVPTVSEVGLPRAEIYGWAGLLAPFSTPPTIIARLNQEVVAILRRPEIQAMFSREGGTAVGKSPQEFRALIEAEQARFAKIALARGIHLEEE